MREVKGISFTSEYKYEYARLQNEENSSKLVCQLLRDYYNDAYTLNSIKEDMQDIKETLKIIVRDFIK